MSFSLYQCAVREGGESRGRASFFLIYLFCSESEPTAKEFLSICVVRYGIQNLLLLHIAKKIIYLKRKRTKQQIKREIINRILNRLEVYFVF